MVHIEYPKYYYQTEEKLGQANKEMSRKKKGSSNRNKAGMKAARIHKNIANQRADFSHKASRKLVDMSCLVYIFCIDMDRRIAFLILWNLK